MVVLVLDNQWRQASLKLVKKFNFTRIHEPIEDYYFVIENGVLKVRKPKESTRFSIHLDFKKEISRLQKQRQGFGKDILCRSLGYEGQKNFRVIDGTLGLAGDALHLISFGIHVLGFEINPIPFCLVEEALSRFPDLKQFLKIRLLDGLKGVSLFSEGVQGLYLDPMFENTKNKSKPKKSMVFLREIAHETCNVQRVIAQALNRGIKRVVVKRPINGDYLYGKPDFLYKGKLVRYDVYRSCDRGIRLT